MLARGILGATARLPSALSPLFLPLFFFWAALVRRLLSSSLLRPSAPLRMPLCLCARHLIGCVPAQRAPRARLRSHAGGMRGASDM